MDDFLKFYVYIQKLLKHIREYLLKILFVEFENRWKLTMMTEIRTVVLGGRFLEKAMRHVSEVMEMCYILIGVMCDV